MEIIIDDIQKTLIVKTYTGVKIIPFYSKESFEIILKKWLKVGLNKKWMGQGYYSSARSIFETHKMKHF